jgi:hypothetical protein
VLHTHRRCYQEGKSAILSVALVKAWSTVLFQLLHRGSGRLEFSEITSLSISIDDLSWNKSNGYISCKRFTEHFPRLACLEIGIGYTEHYTFHFSQREIAESEVASEMWDAVLADLCGASLHQGLDRMGSKTEYHWHLWVRHMVLTRMSNAL